jgi:hypothetical protein
VAGFVHTNGVIVAFKIGTLSTNTFAFLIECLALAPPVARKTKVSLRHSHCASRRGKRLINDQYSVYLYFDDPVCWVRKIGFPIYFYVSECISNKWLSRIKVWRMECTSRGIVEFNIVSCCIVGTIQDVYFAHLTFGSIVENNLPINPEALAESLIRLLIRNLLEDWQGTRM